MTQSSVAERYDLHHQFQRKMLKEHCEEPILNAACQRDPANLGRDFNATNMDIMDYDQQSRMSLYELPNFVCGSITDAPFDNFSFQTIVLGELLEHCTFEAAKSALCEVYCLLRTRGKLVLTFPQDPRRKELQHAPELLYMWEEGITSWHSHVWTEEELVSLFRTVGFREVHREILHYGPLNGLPEGCPGLGILLIKEDNV